MSDLQNEQPGPSWPTADRTAFRLAVRDWVAANWDTTQTVRHWWSTLAASGLAVPTWPKPLGGLSATMPIQAIVEEELGAAGTIAPPQGGIGVRIVAPTLRQHMPMEQSARLLAPMIRGEEAWCLLFGEQDADEEMTVFDTLAIAERAQWQPEVNSWTLNGEKRLPDDYASARRALVMARTDQTSTERKGLTCFVLDLQHPGVVVDAQRGVVTLTDVVITRDDLVGDVDAGWQVVRTTTAYAVSSNAGRIRRGLIDVASGEPAGNLDRVISELVASRPQPAARGTDRRAGR